MPPSIIQSDITATTRNSDHNEMVARWNSTRDRVEEDEHRMSLSDDGESDLHERDNWPLVNSTERDSSPDTVISIESRKRYQASKLEEEEDTRRDTVLRRSDDFGDLPATSPDDEDVSDLEEDSDESGRDPGGGESRESPPPALDIAGTEEGSPNSDTQHPQPQNEGIYAERSRPSGSDSRDGSVDVSPLRELDSAFSSGSVAQLPTSPRNAAAAGHPQENETYHNVNGHAIHSDEERDIATPIQFGMDSTSETSSIHPSSPPSYGRITPTTNGPARPSSITKSTPPSRTASRRSQHVTPLRDRVRYSWQSVQDEEPNRPRIHIIKLISNTATASAGFPQGEAFGFSMSPGGRRLAAYNSARLYILQTAALPVGISQDFALKRRPQAVEIGDDGNVLAILADEHTINIYDLGHQQLRRMRTIKTDFPTNCIAISPTGALLAAAYEGGVEIFSLANGSLPTDRRAVRCPKMDRLTFSEDSATLLGTTVRINVSSTMAVSVPVFPSSGKPSHEELKEAWCSELLHPENVRNSSHAIFMRENRETANDRLFAWNGLEDTFGILNIGDMQYGAIEFPVVISPPLSTCGGLGAAIHSPPALDEHGDTVAMIVNDRTIRLYIVPRRHHEEDTTVEAHSIDHELDEGYGCPFSEVRWVYSSTSLPAPSSSQPHVQGRLVVTSPGGIADSSLNEEPVDDVEGGRIILFDFDPQFAGQAGQTFSLTLGKSQPQLLEEPAFDVAAEVALVRRRTVNQSRGGGLSTRPITLGRTASTFSRRNERSSPRSGTPSGRALRTSLLSISSEASRSLPDLMESSEALDTFEEPYAQGAPRSHASLQRAASNAQRHRFQTIEEKNREHISADSTGGFLALPEYSEEPNAPLPSRFRALAGLDTPASGPAIKPALITSPNGDRQSPTSSTPSTAPAAVAESFSADQAFHAATIQTQAESSSAAQQSPVESPLSDEQFSLISGSGPLPNITGEWEAPSPVTSTNSGRQFQAPPRSLSSRSGALSPPMESAPEEDDLYSGSPTVGSRRGPSSPLGRSAQASTTYRYSTSLLNSPGHPSPTFAPSISSFDAGSESPTSTVSSRTRRLPPHLVAFRNAATTSASASLFPTNQRSDHVPVREHATNAGSVPHPVTAWHPPAPSITSAAPSGVFRAHSRKSSVSNRSAFASTAKAKKLGFFRTGTKKRKNQALFGPEYAPRNARQGGRGGADSMLETKSMFTTLTRGEGKCAVM